VAKPALRSKKPRKSAAGKEILTTPDHSPAINTRWFQDQIRAKDVTQETIAATLGLDKGAFSRLLNGKRRMQADEAAAISKALNLDIGDVLFNAGIAVSDLNLGGHDGVEIVGWVDGAGDAVLKALSASKRAPSLPGVASGGVRALRLQTAGQGPLDCLDGGLVYFAPRKAVENTEVGRLCLIQVKGRKAPALRVLRKGYQAGAWNLYSLAGTMTDQDVVVESASPVVWIKLG